MLIIKCSCLFLRCKITAFRLDRRYPNKGDDYLFLRISDFFHTFASNNPTMKRQLNISDIALFAKNDEHIALHENFAIIRNVARIKEQMSGRIGDLLYIPMGRVLMVTEGAVRLRLNLQPCSVEKGKVIVIPENFFMEVSEMSADYNAQIVTFSNIPIPFKRWSAVTVAKADSRRIGRYFDLLWQVVKSSSCCQSTLDNLLSALLSDLRSLSELSDANRIHDASTAAEQLTQRFFDLLAESDGTARSVPLFADRLCVTPNHLSAVIKQQTGQTVMQLASAHALLKIKLELRYGDTPLQEIAEHFGFENPPAFSRFFKNLTGITPSAFRNATFTHDITNLV